MSNIKKGAKLTVSTGNGISTSTSNNLGVLEVSGPGLANVVSQDSTFSLGSSNVPQVTIGAIDNSGIFQIGVDNNGNSILEATENGNNNNLLIQQLGGYVGIGTTNPASTFHVNSTDALIIPVGTTTNRPGQLGQITAVNGMIRYNTQTSQFEGYGPGSAWGSLGGVKDVDGDTYILAESSAGADNDDLQFFTAGQERMIVNSSGHVGIGTTNPRSTFDISSTDGLIIPVGTNGERPNPAYNGMIRYNTTTSQFEGYGPGSAWGSLGGVKDVNGDTYILAESSAGANNDDLQFFTAGQERMSINSVGDVSMNGNITTDVGYPYYQSLGTYNIVNPPSTTSTVHGVNITAMNKRTRASYASAEACVSTWTARSAVSSSWYSVCWAPELSKFVAVASSGTNKVMTSPDGITWTARSSPSSNWNSVCWSPELSKFVAVAWNGTDRVMTSTDGISWVGSTVESSNWNSVCWSPELSIFVAVAYNGTDLVMTSSDGSTWTGRSAAEDADWMSVCWSPELSIFVAVSQSGTDRVMTSPDGETWTARSPPSGNWMSVCWSPELSIFVAVAYTGTIKIMTSPDGETWTARSPPSGIGYWFSVCWSPELSIFVAVAYTGTNKLMTSPDGITWTARSAPSNAWRGVCWSPELSIFVAVEDSGTNMVMTSAIGMPNSKSVVKALPSQMSVDANGVLTVSNAITTDVGYPYYQSLGSENIVNPPSTTSTVHGVNITAMNKRTRASYASAEACVSTWTQRTATFSNKWCTMCWAPELSIFVAVSENGTYRAMTSPDGITWTVRETPAFEWFALCWSPELSLLVSMSTSGHVMTSSDGINWSYQTSLGSRTFVSVCWAPELSKFVAVSQTGTYRVVTSSNGITWSSSTSSTAVTDSSSWRTVCWSPELSLFVAVAEGGTYRVMTSPDGTTWTAQTSFSQSGMSTAPWPGVCWSPELSLFVAVGRTTSYIVMTSPDGINWTLRTSPINGSFYTVCWSPELSLFVSVSYNTANIIYSPDGIIWTSGSTSVSSFWYSICWAPELSIFAIVSFTNKVVTSAIGMPNSKSVVKALPSQMSVLPNGNVGIGTSTPSYKLDVNGTGRFAGDVRMNDDLTVDGYVSIGTTAPSSYRLNVNGSANFTGDVSMNTGVGIGTNPKTNIALDIRQSGVLDGFRVQTSTSNQYIYSARFAGNSGKGLTVWANGSVFIGQNSSGGHNNHRLLIAGNEVNDQPQIYAYDAHRGMLVNNVQDRTASTASQYNRYALYTAGGPIRAHGYYYSGDGRNYSIWSAQNTFSAGNYVGSDRRIKNNIVDVPDHLALTYLRNIPCCYYNYIDSPNQKKTIGFIAQEVREVFPIAVDKIINFIPNIMQTVSGEWIEKEDGKYDFSSNFFTDISFGTYKFHLKEDISSVNFIEKDVIMNDNRTFTFENSHNAVFCYGIQIDDFHALDKAKLFALNFSATQEIDRIQQQHIIDISNAQTTIQQQETTIQTLQTDISTANTTIQQHETTIQQQQQQIADILSRLESLESSA